MSVFCWGTAQVHTATKYQSQDLAPCPGTLANLAHHCDSPDSALLPPVISVFSAQQLLAL